MQIEIAIPYGVLVIGPILDDNFLKCIIYLKVTCFLELQKGLINKRYIL